MRVPGIVLICISLHLGKWGPCAPLGGTEVYYVRSAYAKQGTEAARTSFKYTPVVRGSFVWYLCAVQQK